MSSKQKNFMLLVRDKAAKWPTERGFTEESWTKAWQNSSNNEDADRNIFDAGFVFNTILSELRNEIEELYTHSPNVSSIDLLKAYCGIANRDRAVIQNHPIQKGLDITALRTSNNVAGNELSLQEVADGCVDAIENAVRSKIIKPHSCSTAHKNIDPFIFILKESSISQLYGIYEDYWRALVWGDYKISKINDNDDYYLIQQIASSFNISYEASQLRRSKLQAQTVPFVSDKSHLRLMGEKPCIVWVRIGKKKRLAVKAAKEMSELYQVLNASFMYQTMALFGDFPEDFLRTDRRGLGYSTVEIIEVFRLLVVLSQISQDNFPQDDSLFSFSKALRFCPTVNRSELIRAICQATDFEFEKSSKIIDFLTFKGERNKDLWCHPIINIGKSEVTYLVAALVSPALQRVVEHWIAQTAIKLADKGGEFERNVITNINSRLRENPIFRSCDEAVSRRIKLAQRGEEEIDLLLTFGDVVIVGELKSIFVTDSEISLYRTRETIDHAAQQATRKAKFVNDNISAVFNTLQWNFVEQRNYRILPLVVVSSGICVGYASHNVPVCDLRIVSKYFSDHIVPLISIDKDEHIAWFELYSDIRSAAENIHTYLRSPPQVTLSRDDFEHLTCPIPVVSENSPKIAFSRLVKKKTDLNDLLSRSYPFPLRLSDDFHEAIADFNAIL